MGSTISYCLGYVIRALGVTVFLFAIIVPALVCNAQSELEPLDIKLDGRVWIEGEAGMFNYKCNLQQLSQASQITSLDNPQKTIADSQNVDLAFRFPVTSFNCNKESINDDLYEALKFESHPTISFQLMAADPRKEVNDTTSSSWIPIHTYGIMEMAGVQENTNFSIKGKVLDKQRYQVKGSKIIHMKKYAIDPPSTIGGLVTADEVLSVHFDVMVEVKDSPNK
jgi:hypothetical protein